MGKYDYLTDEEKDTIVRMVEAYRAKNVSTRLLVPLLDGKSYLDSVDGKTGVSIRSVPGHPAFYQGQNKRAS